MSVFTDVLGRIGINVKTGTPDNVKVKSDGDMTTGADAFASSLGSAFNQNFSSFNNQKQQLASYVEWVYVGASAIAEHCAAIDWRVFQNNTGVKNAAVGQKLVYFPKEADKLKARRVNLIERKDGKLIHRKDVEGLEELENHPLLDLLNNPNPFMGKNEFFEIAFLHLVLTGDSFWAVFRDKKGNPAELWPLMPDRMTVVPDKSHFVIGYLYQSNGEQVPFAPDDIIHHKLGNPTDFHRGYSPIMAGARTIDTDTQAAEWNRKTMYNSATPNGVFKTDAKLDDAVFKRLKQEIMDTFGGAANHGKPVVLEQGLDFKAISMSAKDMDFLNMRNFNRDQILAILGVPRSIVGLDESMSRANAETAEYVFSKRNRNKMQRIANRITEDLAIQFADNLVVSFTDPVPEDKEYVLKETQAALANSPYQTVNEERAKRGDDPIDGGDELWISNLLVPMSIALTTAENPPVDPNSPAADPDDDGDISDDDGDTGDADDGSGDNTDTNGDNDENNSSSDNSGSTSSESTNDSGSSAKTAKRKHKTYTHVKGEREIPDGYVLCVCCDGWGEHDSGSECYRCDSSGVCDHKEAQQPEHCDGWYPDGNGGRGEKSVRTLFTISKKADKLPQFPAPIDDAHTYPATPPQEEVMGESSPKGTPPTADDEAASTSTKFEINNDMQKWLNTRARIVGGFENQMLRTAMELFALQKHEVLSNLHSVVPEEKGSGKSQVKEAKKKMNSLFDKGASAAAWSGALLPIYAQIGIRAGNGSMDLVNDPQKYGYDAEPPETPFTYDANTEPIKQYFTQRAGTVSKGIDEETDKQLRAKLTEGINNGEGLGELADRVESIYNAAAGYRALRIARTETQSALHFASMVAWNQAGVVESYIWITAAGPCPICSQLANVVSKDASDFNGMSAPAHPNCRCEAIPYIISGVTALDDRTPVGAEA